MRFAEKLQLLRKSKGWTQEELADELSLSRQTVTKWESGQGYPDIENLIAISELFLVTVDYLVKEDSCRTQPGTALKECPDLIAFLIKAKIGTYAGKARRARVPALHRTIYPSRKAIIFISTPISAASDSRVRKRSGGRASRYLQ